IVYQQPWRRHLQRAVLYNAVIIVRHSRQPIHGDSDRGNRRLKLAVASAISELIHPVKCGVWLISECTALFQSERAMRGRRDENRPQSVVVRIGVISRYALARRNHEFAAGVDA